MLKSESDRSKIILRNLQTVLDEIDNRATLVAVTKYSPVEDIRLAHLHGQKDFAENRVIQLSERSFELKDLDINWHFIGNLQKNKVKKLFEIPNLFFVHSVSSLSLLKEMIKRESILRNKLKFFLQVNFSDEDEKSGFSSIEEVREALDYFDTCNTSNLEFAGIMGMGKIRTNNFEEEAFNIFKKIYNLKETIESERGESLLTSMGMSNDYLLAIEQGSDMVRIGSKIFKE